MRYYWSMSCHFDKLKNWYEINVCIFELIWLSWSFSMHFWLAKWTKCILSEIYNVFPVGYKPCTHQCECVFTKYSFITEEHVYRNFRISWCWPPNPWLLRNFERIFIFLFCPKENLSLRVNIFFHIRHMCTHKWDLYQFVWRAAEKKNTFLIPGTNQLPYVKSWNWNNAKDPSQQRF